MVIQNVIVHHSSIHRAAAGFSMAQLRSALGLLRHRLWRHEAKHPALEPPLPSILGDSSWTFGTLLTVVALLFASALVLLARKCMSLYMAWTSQARREAALEQALDSLHGQREELERALATSARQIDEFKALLKPRSGLLASVLVPSDQWQSPDSEEGAARRVSLRTRKLAEFLSLLLDVLNWKLGQGSPLSRAQFWEAFEMCEAMARDLAPSATEASSCLAQLHRLVLEFERVPSGVLLQWRWLPVSAALARRHGPSSSGRLLLELNREMAISHMLPTALQADGQASAQPAAARPRLDHSPPC